MFRPMLPLVAVVALTACGSPQTATQQATVAGGAFTSLITLGNPGFTLVGAAASNAAIGTVQETVALSRNQKCYRIADCAFSQRYP